MNDNPANTLEESSKPNSPAQSISASHPEQKRKVCIQSLHPRKPREMLFVAKHRAAVEENVQMSEKGANVVAAATEPPVNEPSRDVMTTPVATVSPKRPFLVAVAIIGLAIATGVSGFFLGFHQGRASSSRTVARVLQPEETAQVHHAMMELRAGESGKALATLKSMASKFPGVPSLSYLAAVAALQAGDIDAAEVLTKQSIQHGERLSDALALQSVLAKAKSNDRSQVTLRDPKLVAETLLRQAISVDVANPYPHFELANLLRSKGRKEEAVQEIRIAQALLNPVDSHIVMDVTLQLMTLEKAPASELPTTISDSGEVDQAFPAAYVEMRRGDYNRAAALLQKCRQSLTPELFDYLVNDPALRKFSSEPQLSEFFSS